MRILAIDTASRSCGVALLDDRDVLAEINDVSGQTHSRHLMAMVEQVIAMSAADRSSIDGYAVTKGPGSFTGLRIGISTAKGLAEAAGKPLVGVSSLEALAWQGFPAETVIIPMLDARRKEVYTARFRNIGGTLQSTQEEQALPPETAVEDVDSHCLLIGDGAVAYAERLRVVLGDRMQLAQPFQHIIRASTVACLAREHLLEARDERVALTPHYIRKSYVEEGRHDAR